MMKQEDIIKKKDEQIDKLIALVDKLIQDRQNVQVIRNIGPNDDMCTDGGPHDWPNQWGGTTPPCCNKCGKSAPGMIAWGTHITDNSGPSLLTDSKI